MGLFSKSYSIVEKIGGGKILIKLDERDVKTNGTYIVPKDIIVIYDHAFSNTGVKSVVVDKNCKGIGENAFQNCQQLVSIALPEGITEIRQGAFENCENLEEIIIPEGVTEIPENLFANCKNLRRVVLPSTIKSIGKNAFAGCESLQNIVLPEGLQTISENAFEGCFSLREITIPSTVTKIGNAFSRCSALSKVEIKSNITKLESWFAGCEGLETLILPSSIKEIGDNALEGCYSLKNIKLPQGVERIGNSAFKGCKSITELSIPDSVVEMGSAAFWGCSYLTKINIPGSVKNINNSTFSFCTSLKEVILGEGIQTISQNVFNGCESLTQIKLPESLKKLERSVFTNSGLTSVTIPAGVEKMNATFNGCKNISEVDIKAPLPSLGDSCFTYTKNLKSITLPDTLRKVDSACFLNAGIEEIILPDSVTEICEGAFIECEELKSIKFSANLKIIERDAFAGCKNIETITLPEGLESIDAGVFAGCESLKEIKIPETTTKIGNEAFKNCSNLEHIELPSGLKNIRTELFRGCKSLKEVIIPSGVKQLMDGAFAYSGITALEIPSSVTVVRKCLDGCDDLETVTINGQPIIDSDTLLKCPNLRTLNLPDGLRPDQKLYLSSCKNLQEINYRGKKIPVTEAILDSFHEIIPFLDYAIDNNKFIPRNASVLLRTKPEEIQNFYSHSKDWQTILNAYISKFGAEASAGDALAKQQMNDATEGLYQACIMLGLFQDGEAGKRAREFIEQNILELEPGDIHRMFAGLNTKAFGYNEEFAKFFIQNYEKPYEQEDRRIYFMHKEISSLTTAFYGQVNKYYKNYIVAAYHAWDKVKEAYPNKTVLARREQGSENNNLTFEDIVNAIDISRYNNVKEGNEEMARLVGRYGYDQREFEILQELFEEGKKVKEEMMLAVPNDPMQEGIRYNLLSKDDPKGLVLGTITNCCQELHNAGQDCMKYGVTAKNSGFVEFTYQGQTVGQSWVWYNEETKTICLDNIEVPTVWIKKIQTEKGSKSFIECLTRLASGFKAEMEKQGLEVKEVTIGAGYNDLSAIRAFEKREVDGSVLPADYHSYSDATRVQYVVPIKEMRKEVVADTEQGRQ